MSDPSTEASGSRGLRRTLIVLVVLALAVAGVLYGLRAIQPVAIVEVVGGGPALDARSGSVTVAEDYSMDLKTEQPGRLLAEDFNLEPGESVREGEILARLDAKELQLQYDKSKTDYDAMVESNAVNHTDELNLAAEKKALANDRIELDQGRISQTDYDKYDLSYKLDVQNAALHRIAIRQNEADAKNALEVLQDQIGRMTIRAPFDGIVKSVTAHPGDLIDRGNAIATLMTRKMRVISSISDEDFAKIRVGQDASVEFLPYGNWIFRATVAQILPAADPQTQRHQVYLNVVLPPDKPIVPGMNGEVSITVDRHHARTVVPRRAVFSFDGDSVYVVDDGIVHRRPVQKGFVWDRGVEIVKGVNPGDAVIVEDLEDFREGERVRAQAIPSDVFSKVVK